MVRAEAGCLDFILLHDNVALAGIRLHDGIGCTLECRTGVGIAVCGDSGLRRNHVSITRS
ncbi:hypothetical protein ACPPVO_36475 [Dactylosporangium sp. McL0621]|uniref:hypothetical protein n=1 Tax=Dactylosporangium sp. McL0621 TaxID=3415678 RepID=UPI003CEA6959